MRIDENGNAWWDWLAGIFAVVGVALVIGAITVLTAGVGTTILAGTLAGAVIHGAAIGTLIGAGVGLVAGGIIGGAVSGWTAQGIFAGMGIGLGAGAIIGAVIGGAVGGLAYTPSGLSRSAINQAVKNTLADSNKMAHIMQPQHNLPASIKQVGRLMKKTLINGEITPYKSVSSVIWKVANSKVTYTIIAGAIRISDMWIF